MIRAVLSLCFLLPMSVTDLKERIVPLSLSISLFVLSVVWGTMHNFNDGIVALCYSTGLFVMYVITLPKNRTLGGADILVIMSIMFMFTVQISAIIILIAIGFSFMYLFLTKEEDVPYVFMLTLAMIFVDLFSKI